jgi:hypothetical protein
MIVGPDGRPIINMDDKEERTKFLLRAIGQLVATGLSNLANQGLEPPQVVTIVIDGARIHLASNPEIARQLAQDDAHCPSCGRPQEKKLQVPEDQQKAEEPKPTKRGRKIDLQAKDSIEDKEEPSTHKILKFPEQ